MAVVDWQLLSRALTYYMGNGFQYIEVPWIVPPAIHAITCPDQSRIMMVAKHGGLVGSAEQSFIALDSAGVLGKGRFVALTPCFRDEFEVDELHQRHFMKVELYRNDDTSNSALEEMIAVAELFFYLDAAGGTVERVQTEEGFDLMLNGIEVGSYGIREANGLKWVYGTGLAEPRFSTAKKHGV